MMEYPIERLVPYPIAALCVLLLFYGVYVAKLWALKRHGINGRQIGKRKERDIHTVELLMSVATVGIIPARSHSAGACSRMAHASRGFVSACWGICCFAPPPCVCGIAGVPGSRRRTGPSL